MEQRTVLGVVFDDRVGSASTVSRISAQVARQDSALLVGIAIFVGERRRRASLEGSLVCSLAL